MTVEQLLKEKREAILEVAAKHGARNVRVFGSVARGEADEHATRGREAFEQDQPTFKRAIEGLLKALEQGK